MSITTMEELEALPDGEEILVAHPTLGNQTWTKQEGGFVRDGSPTVKIGNFIGAVSTGQVRSMVGPQVGEVYANAVRHRYLVLRVDDDRHIQLCWVRDNTYRDLLTYTTADLANLTRVAADEHPPWVEPVQQVATALLEASERVAAAAPTDPSVRYLTDEMVRSLHRYARSVNEGEFDDLLTEIGISRYADHESVVTITGTTEYSVDADEASNYMAVDDGPDFDITDVGTATIYWRRTVRVTNNGVGCTCADISLGDLNDYLPRRYEDVEFSTECAVDDPF